MIEHVSFPQGQLMLSECFRVLSPGGMIRVSTPDLAFLVALYREQRSDREEDYIKWLTEVDIPYAPASMDTFVINHFVRAWGHEFIHDEKTLRLALERAGFSDIRRCELNQSETGVLRKLENEERIPPGFLELETLTLEATRPA